MRMTLTTVAVLAVAMLNFGAEPATKPAANAPQPMLGEMNIQTFPEMSFVYASQQTTFQEIGKVYEKVMPVIDKAVEDGALKATGPMLSVYPEYKMDGPFTLEVGMLVRPGAKEPAGLKLRKTAPFKCATLLYTGPVQGIGAAYGKLMGQIQAQKLAMTGEFREMYVYWEKIDSPNNIIQIQAGLK